jgi:hypothetical protein
MTHKPREPILVVGEGRGSPCLALHDGELLGGGDAGEGCRLVAVDVVEVVSEVCRVEVEVAVVAAARFHGRRWLTSTRHRTERGGGRC